MIQPDTAEPSRGYGINRRADMNRPLVAFMLPSLEVGGAERHTLELLKWLPRNRVRLGVVLANRVGPLLKEVPPDVKIWDLHGAGHRQIIQGAARFARLLEREQPDVVVARLWFGVCLTHLATRLSRWHGRTVNVEDAMPVDYRRIARLGWLKQRWVRRAHEASDRVIAVSAGVCEQLRSLGVEDCKVDVVPNGLNTANIARQASEPVAGLPSGPYIAQVGSLKSLKGPDRLIAALPCLHDSISVVFVGTGPMLPELKRRAVDLDVDRRVHFVGLKTNPYPYMARAALLVMPSRLPEADALSALEALALGTPVLVPERPYRVLPTGHPMELTFACDDDADLVRKLKDAISRIDDGTLQSAARQVLPGRSLESAVERFTRSVLD